MGRRHPAALLEVVFATSLKLSENFSRLWPSVGFIVTAARLAAITLIVGGVVLLNVGAGGTH